MKFFKIITPSLARVTVFAESRETAEEWLRAHARDGRVLDADPPARDTDEAKAVVKLRRAGNGLVRHCKKGMTAEDWEAVGG